MLQLINRPSSTGAVGGVAAMQSSPKQSRQDELPAVPSGSDSAENPDEWGEFLHCPGKKFYNFNEIRDEVLLNYAD